RGRRAIASSDDLPQWVAFEPTTGTTAITTSHLVISARDGRVVVAAEALHGGALAFEDPDRLPVLRDDPERTALWRFVISTRTWTRIVDLPAPSAALATANGLVFACAGKAIHVLRDGHELARYDLGEDVVTMTLSADQRWMSANTETGHT